MRQRRAVGIALLLCALFTLPYFWLVENGQQMRILFYKMA